MATTTNILSKRFIGKVTGHHTEGDQNHIFSYFCGIYNLKDEVERLMNKSETTYWAEADRFGFLATNSNDAEYQNKVMKIIEGVVNYAGQMSDNSEAICYFNIAKIYLKQGNRENYNQYLIKAKNKSSKLIEKRLEHEELN